MPTTADTYVAPVPAVSIDAEQALLGAMFLDATACMADCRAIIKHSEMFYRTLHRKVWEAQCAVYDAGGDVNFIAVGDWLRRDGFVFDQADLVALAEKMAQSAGATQWAEIVRDKYIARSFGRLGAELSAAATDPTLDPVEAIERVQAAVADLQMQRETTATASASDLMAATQAALDRYAKFGGADACGVPTGFQDLNRLTGGFLPGELVIWAARPGVGKTVALMQAAYGASETHPALVCSLEMSCEDLGIRLLACESGISSWFLKHPDAQQPWQAKEIKETIARIQSRKFFVSDAPNMTVNDIRAAARRLSFQHEIKVVCVDYLQLMGVPRGGRRDAQRYEQVGEMTRGLKLLARELGVVVIAAAQLNRKIESRGDSPVPMLSDLRESGSIEQDADKVIFIVPPKPAKEGEVPDENKRAYTEFHLAKNRNGETGIVRVHFNKECSRFEPAATAAPDGFVETGNRLSR